MVLEDENAYSEMLNYISPSYYNIWLNRIYIYIYIYIYIDYNSLLYDYMVNNIYQTSLRERWFVQNVDTQVLRYDIIRYLMKDISKLCILERMLLLRIAIIAVSVASKQQTKHGAYRIRVFLQLLWTFCFNTVEAAVSCICFAINIQQYFKQQATTYIFTHF